MTNEAFYRKFGLDKPTKKYNLTSEQEVQIYVKLVKDILDNTFNYELYTKDKDEKALIDDMILYEELMPAGNPVITQEAWEDITSCIYNYYININN